MAGNAKDSKILEYKDLISGLNTTISAQIEVIKSLNCVWFVITIFCCEMFSAPLPCKAPLATRIGVIFWGVKLSSLLLQENNIKNEINVKIIVFMTYIFKS